MLTNHDLSAIQKLISEEVQGTEKRLIAKIDKVNEALSGKIAKTQETVDIVQNVVVNHYGKLDQRVTNLEEELNIHKN